MEGGERLDKYSGVRTAPAELCQPGAGMGLPGAG